jgi:hypothetical protein
MQKRYGTNVSGFKMHPSLYAQGQRMRNLCLAAVLVLAGCAQIPYAEVLNPPRPEAPVVVTDIDGTLTNTIWATNEVRVGAAEVLQAFAREGFTIVYLSTRVPWLQQQLPLWLSENGFPAGALHVAQNASERNDPRAYKAQILEAYRSRGWKLEYAYGDSETDFLAYQDARIPIDHVYGIQRVNESTCQPGPFSMCLKRWTDYRRTIKLDAVR